MNVIKKDGRLQEFDSSKLRTSILNASRDTKNGVLNESDIKIIIDDVNIKLNKLRSDGTPTSSYEIIGVICEVLVKDGFSNIVHEFIVHE